MYSILAFAARCVCRAQSAIATEAGVGMKRLLTRRSRIEIVHFEKNSQIELSLRKSSKIMIFKRTAKYDAQVMFNNKSQNTGFYEVLLRQLVPRFSHFVAEKNFACGKCKIARGNQAFLVCRLKKCFAPMLKIEQMRQARCRADVVRERGCQAALLCHARSKFAAAGNDLPCGCELCRRKSDESVGQTLDGFDGT
jgi:hypothetical protein